MSRMYIMHDIMVVGSKYRGCRHRSCWPWPCSPSLASIITFHSIPFWGVEYVIHACFQGRLAFISTLPHWDRGYVKFHIECSYRLTLITPHPCTWPTTWAASPVSPFGQPEATGSKGLCDRSSRSTRDDRFNMSQ
jgi:hypothetical protein